MYTEAMSLTGYIKMCIICKEYSNCLVFMSCVNHLVVTSVLSGCWCCSLSGHTKVSLSGKYNAFIDHRESFLMHRS